MESLSEARPDLIGNRYEYGKIVSTGMIGIVYMVRDIQDPFLRLRCLKRMPREKMGEKNIYSSIKRECQILFDLRAVKGCIRLLDIICQDDFLSYVFPFYPKGDLYHHYRVNPNNTMKEHWV